MTPNEQIIKDIERSVHLRRPVVRYHGGKWRLAPWIIQHFPEHRVYVEPFGGGGSVLLRKDRSYAEIYNDLDGEIVNLFRVLRDYGDDLRKEIYLTPFARDEFDLSYEPSLDPIEQARRTAVRCGMGFGSSAMNTQNKTGFRGSATRSGTHPGLDWTNQFKSLAAVVERLQGVVIENKNGVELMEYHDALGTLHYVDPPYVHDTRKWKGGKEAYRHELTNEQHVDLISRMKALKGFVFVSGYPSDLYAEHLAGWHMVETGALADKAGKRTECLWMNESAYCAQHQAELFT